MKYSLHAILFGGLFFSACQQQPASPDAGAPLALSSHSGSTSTSPNLSWTFMSETWSKGANHFTIAVSDSDGTDKTDVYVATGGTNTEQTRFPTWGPGATSISFVDAPPPFANSWYNGTSYGSYSIKAVDVSISNGSVHSANSRTICSYASSDSVKIIQQSWCRASGVNKIAFIGVTPTDGGIYVVSSSGGIPTKIFSLVRSQGMINAGSLEGNGIGWSPDGSKIAFAERDSASDGTITYEIKIINADGSGTPTVLDQGSHHFVGAVQWAHSGNLLSYIRSTSLPPTAGQADLYTIDVTNGTTTFVHSNAECQFWSPNNSELVYQDRSSSTYVMKKADVASGSATTISISTGYIANYGDWK